MGATFPQDLFVELRRAGWPVSPVLEGRVQIDGRSLRLLGIEPVTLPPMSATRRASARRSAAFVTPPGQTLVAPETLSDLKLTEGAAPPISSGAKLPPLHVQPQLVPDVLVVDIGIAQRFLNKPDQVSRLLIGKTQGQARSRSEASSATSCSWSSRMRRPIWSASPTVFIST